MTRCCCRVVVCRCRSPPASGAGAYYHVIVSVSGSSTVFPSALWVYDPPYIVTAAPSLLHPDPNATLVLDGANFGWVPGVVSVAGHVVVCGVWSNEHVECAAPSGVVDVALVRVSAASGMTALLPAVVHYRYEPLSSALRSSMCCWNAHVVPTALS